jgi:hypothetical protein
LQFFKPRIYTGLDFNFGSVGLLGVGDVATANYNSEGYIIDSRPVIQFIIKQIVVSNVIETKAPLF